MKNVFEPLIIHQKMFEDGQEYGDKYFGQVLLISITSDVILAAGQMQRADRKHSRAEYAKAFDQYKTMGYTDMLYHSPKGRKDLSGDQVYVQRNGEYQPVTGLYLKQL